MTMTLVSSVTVGSGGAASIDFTSIPQTGTDLLVVVSARNGGNAFVADWARLRFNGDSTTTYQTRFLLGDGSAVSSVSNPDNSITAVRVPANSATASTFGNGQIYIPNYAGSTQKSVSTDAVGENNATAAPANITAGLWPVTSAITSLTLFCSSTFAQYSTASLYTVTKGSGGASVS